VNYITSFNNEGKQGKCQEKASRVYFFKHSQQVKKKMRAFLALPRQKPGFPLQCLANREAVCCGISAAILDAWASSNFAIAKLRPALGAPRAMCASRDLILYTDGKRRCPGMFPFKKALSTG
jgi:hypothetical protein